MNARPVRIGITASGGDMVPSAILALRKNEQLAFYIHAFNLGFHPVSAYLADKFDILPSGASPNFVPQVIEHVKQNNIEVFLPWSDEEALALAAFRDDLSNIGCTVLASPIDVMRTITDKAKTYEILKKAGLTVPEYTVVSSAEDISHAVKAYGYPKRTVVVKPTTGRGGRGVKIFLGDDNPAEWLGCGRREKRLSPLDVTDFDFQNGEPHLVMPCLHAPVYDVDVFRFENTPFKCFVRERLNPTGIPFNGNILRKNTEIEEYAKNIATVMNLQSLHDIDMMTDPKMGPVLLEINPRPSGSLAGLSSAGHVLLDYALASAAGIHIDIKPVERDVEILTYTESVALS